MSVGYCSRYFGRCADRLIHFIDHICGLYISERIIIASDGKSIYYPCEPVVFATCEWIPGTDVPKFTFVGDNAALWNKRQSELWAELLEHQDDMYTHCADEIRKIKNTLLNWEERDDPRIKIRDFRDSKLVATHKILSYIAEVLGKRVNEAKGQDGTKEGDD